MLVKKDQKKKRKHSSDSKRFGSETAQKAMLGVRGVVGNIVRGKVISVYKLDKLG